MHIYTLQWGLKTNWNIFHNTADYIKLTISNVPKCEIILNFVQRCTLFAVKHTSILCDILIGGGDLEEISLFLLIVFECSSL